MRKLSQEFHLLAVVKFDGFSDFDKVGDKDVVIFLILILNVSDFDFKFSIVFVADIYLLSERLIVLIVQLITL